MSYRAETIRDIAVEGVPCGWTHRGSVCRSGKPAVHVLLKSLPVAPRGTALCAYHSPFDTQEPVMIKLTAASQALFVELAEDARNWGSMVPTDGNIDMTSAQRGNLTQLKKAGLIVTQVDEGSTWVLFTEAGLAYAESLGIKGVEALA
jgi:hypothetical protein